MRSGAVRWVVLVLVGLLWVVPLGAAGCGSVRMAVGGDAHGRSDRREIVVMSFNIRYGTANDGDDKWALRDHKVVETIEAHAPDVVALQEAHAFQASELLAALPGYAAAGVHRLDGRVGGEGCITLYRADRFTVGEGGAFFLSETPGVPGSRSWGSAWPRVCVWTRLIDLSNGDGYYIYNTHLDNKSEEARYRSALQMASDIATRTTRRHAADPVVVCGDFNAVPSSRTLRAMLEGTGSGVGLVDAWSERNPNVEVGTYTAFDPESDGGDRRIDFVLCSRELGILDVEIDRRKISGRYPSDHFPVVARLRNGQIRSEAGSESYSSAKR